MSKKKPSETNEAVATVDQAEVLDLVSAELPSSFKQDYELREESDERAEKARRVAVAVAERSAAREQAQLAEYHALVKRTAAGEDVDPDEAAAVVERAGVRAATFSADVEKRRQRADLARAAARRPEAERLVDQVGREIRKLDDERNAMLLDFNTKIEQRKMQLVTLEQTLGNVISARNRLLQSYEGPLRQVAADAQRRAEAANERYRGIQTRIELEANQLQAVEARPDDYHEGEADRVRTRLAALRAALTESRAAELEAVEEGNQAVFAMWEAE